MSDIVIANIVHELTCITCINSKDRSGRKRMRTRHNDFVDSGEIAVKQRRISDGGISTKSGKDDSIPEGYIRVRHKDDCNFVKCAYRQGITHFHCTRPDCGYSFSDRSDVP